MKPKQEFVEACEALAEAFEQVGRPDLSALCDRAGYWLNGGNGVDLISLSEIVESCRETLHEALASKEDQERFIAATVDEITGNLRVIEATVTAARTGGRADDLVEKAARLQAVAILTSQVFK